LLLDFERGLVPQVRLRLLHIYGHRLHRH
jgi:hypothetical protein